MKHKKIKKKDGVGHPFLHCNNTKCICNRTDQNDCCKKRTKIFDHKAEDLLTTKWLSILCDLFF